MNSVVFNRYGKAALLAVATLCIAGCNVSPSSIVPATSDAKPVAPLSGKAMGGEVPLQGATVTLYASLSASSPTVTIVNGTYSGTAKVLGSTTTAADGSFGITITNSACAVGDVIYIAAAGGYNGNIATSSNTAILQVAPIGIAADTTCTNVYTSKANLESSTPTALASTYTVVNEVTSVASAYAFSGFMTLSGSTVNIASPTNNSSSLALSVSTNNVSSGAVSTAFGLQHAFYNALNLATMSTGVANSVPPSNTSAVVYTPPGSATTGSSNVTVNPVAPAATVNTIANALQYCVNSASNTSATCASLFALTPSLYGSGYTATTTLGAALNLARNPYSSSSNVGGIQSMSPTTGAVPFSPSLSVAPADWTLAIAYPVPTNPVSGKGFPFALALDADDNVYVTSPEVDLWTPGASSVVTGGKNSCLFGWRSNGTFRPTITSFVGTVGARGSSGSAATTMGTSNWYCSGSLAAAQGTADNNYGFSDLALDNLGGLWVLDNGTSSSYYKLNYFTANAPGTGTPAKASPSVNPWGIAVDKFNNAWLALEEGSANNYAVYNYSASTVSSATFGGASGTSYPAHTMAFDSAGDLYAPEYSGISGNVTATLYGDSLSYWGLSGSQTGTSYTSGYSALTTGYVLCSGCSAITAALHNNAPFGVATDSSGNAWVTAAGPIGEALNGGTNTGLSVGLAKCTSGTSCSSIANGNFVSPKRLQVDGNGVIWIMDAYGVHAYASTLSTPAFISEETSASNGSAGFAPCIPSTTTCTYPDNLGTINSGATGSYAYSGAKSVAIDSTGSVWWTTPDTTVGNTNANMLIQMIGTAAPTWPLLAKQTPGTMPQ